MLDELKFSRENIHVLTGLGHIQESINGKIYVNGSKLAGCLSSVSK
jgi:hypothetical protein